MTLDDIVGIKTDGGWKPSPVLLSEWRAAGALLGLQPEMIFADADGFPTPLFASIARKAFTGFLPIAEPIVDTDRTRPGYATAALLNWWNKP